MQIVVSKKLGIWEKITTKNAFWILEKNKSLCIDMFSIDDKEASFEDIMIKKFTNQYLRKLVNKAYRTKKFCTVKSTFSNGVIFSDGSRLIFTDSACYIVDLIYGVALMVANYDEEPYFEDDSIYWTYTLYFFDNNAKF